MESDHDEYLERCKERAREYLNRGDPKNAVTSMLSDLSKHSDWSGGKLISMMAALYMVDPSTDNARRIIEGFN